MKMSKMIISFINNVMEREKRIEEARAELENIQRKKMRTLYESSSNLSTQGERRVERFFDQYGDLIRGGLI